LSLPETPDDFSAILSGYFESGHACFRVADIREPLRVWIGVRSKAAGKGCCSAIYTLQHGLRPIGRADIASRLEAAMPQAG
jgi:hypothetical protein